MIQDKKVIIAIPIYRDLREEEIVALDNNLEILHNYPTVLIKPTGLNTNALKERYEVLDEPPRFGKDYNEELLIRLQREAERKKRYER